MTPETPAEVLREAKGVIEQRGWCQDAMEDDYGRVCLMGAINVAIFESSITPWLGDSRQIWLKTQTEKVLVNTVWPGYTLSRIVTFNDAAGRTVDEVLAVLDTAVSNLEGEDHE